MYQPLALFIILILFLLLLDLGVLNRRPHTIHTREALIWTALWVSLSLLFAAGVHQIYEHNYFGIGNEFGHDLTGREATLLYLTSYLTEYSLSMDNIFVIALILTFFKIPPKYHHRVLFWGILGALVLRGVMIALGVALINRFAWITYVFGTLLLVTAVKLLVDRPDDFDPDKSVVIRIVRKFYRVSGDTESGNLFTQVDGKRAITPLFLVLIMVETTDLLFAVDSIPAVFAITTDPFLVFTSNVFAILGLRSMFFALAHLMDKFRYLKSSLVFLLAFIGVKMLIVHYYHIPAEVSLAIIAGILSVGILGSVVGIPRDMAHPQDTLEPLLNDEEDSKRDAVEKENP